MWVATNASEFSIPSLSLLERKISAQIAGPHTVPSGFPTEGLSMEDGKGINPAFYKFHVPFSALEGMLSMAPSEIRNSITPEMIKASITDAGTQKEQAVTLASDDKGLTIDLGLTHFSAPNPVVTFYTPAQVAASNQLLTAARFLKGKSYAVSRLVKISSGYKVSKIVIGSSAKSICTATGTKIKMKKKGTCVFTVTSRKTIRSKTTTKITKGKISVS